MLQSDGRGSQLYPHQEILPDLSRHLPKNTKAFEMQLCSNPHPTTFAVLLEVYKDSAFDTQILRALGKTLPGSH